MVQTKDVKDKEKEEERDSLLKAEPFEIDHDESESVSTRPQTQQRNSMPTKRFLCMGSITCIAAVWLIVLITKRDVNTSGSLSSHLETEQYWKTTRTLPNDLVKNKFNSGGVYGNKDFENKEGRKPPYWQDIQLSAQHKSTDKADELLQTEGILPHWGPCYKPSRSKLMAINWKSEMEKNRNITSEKQIRYPDRTHDARHASRNDKRGNVNGLCRPGFLIIGAGKCGTSSLYHYLVGHPRVLPAKTKQIHYFKYHTAQTMEWYLDYFPGVETFVSSGALMTGEASPGYLPYPDVAHRIKTWIPNRAGNYDGTSDHIEEKGAFPKIITIVRNPLERAWSSYKYNYVQPALDRIKRKHNLRKGEKEKLDDYYIENNLFSFEELITAELEVLRRCLHMGVGEMKTSLKYKKLDQWRPEFSRREENKLPGLIVIDEYCYGNQISQSVPRRQWEGLVQQYPDKIINVPNIFLVQSLIGRSLYTFPLEWWYAIYPKDDLYIVCNENLKHETAKTMSDLSDFLGLPEFDFTEAVSAGMYNVGDHRGYDKPTKWDPNNETAPQIPISDQLKEEFLTFVQPYNERLFKLMGKRCNW